MTGAIIAVAAILLGLPFLAWWTGNRRFWSRLSPQAEADPWRDAMRQFGLTPGETAQVESAVMWGRRLDDERLRRAAVQWAQQLIDSAKARRRARSGWGVAAVLSGTIGVLSALAYFAFVRRDGFPWGVAVYWVIGPAWVAWMASGPRRAIRANSDQGPTSGN